MLVKALVGLVFGLLLLVGVGFLGLQIKPRSFAPYPASTATLKRVPIPQGLPEPVDRFYRTISGDSVPVIESAVFTGRGHLRFGGLRMSTRMRFTHQAGEAYRHYIETTLFGIPIMKVNEHYLEGHARLELPVGLIENEPKVDSGANLALWAESVFFPSLFLTDPRVRWEPLGKDQAYLVVPGPDGEERLHTFFDPQTGLLLRMEAPRWKGPESEQKVNWICEVRGWERFYGMLLPSVFAVTWGDEGRPWLVATVEEIVFNSNVGPYIRATGP